ncbi:hypothetical protein [Streptomyces daliensis]|uniref:Uncharacterized protein n=1 Tax=Streptomyces daliensis TaxID=299421 RepID=A0A8T4IS63_9ACTN|nr:hypothetical protein [Streptomyces daliensis]
MSAAVAAVIIASASCGPEGGCVPVVRRRTETGEEVFLRLRHVTRRQLRTAQGRYQVQQGPQPADTVGESGGRR